MADALSKQGEEDIYVALLSIPTVGWVEEIKLSYDHDPKLLQLQEQCTQGSLNPHYLVRETLLFYKGRLYISMNKNLRKKLLQFILKSSSGGHSGFDKIMARAKREFFCPSLRLNVQ